MFWLNGDFIEESTACISAMDRGLLLGEGVFDTLLLNNGTSIDWQLHYNRLLSSAKFFGISAPYTDIELRQAINILIKKNNLNRGRAGLRITATSGTGGRGLVAKKEAPSTWLLQVFSFSNYKTPVCLVTSPIRRNEYSPTSQHKTTNYIDLIVARKQAMELDYDGALLYNSKGYVACSCAGNIFIQLDKQLLTPPIEDGALSGITRQKILSLDDIGPFKIIEQSITEKEIIKSDAIFFCNSLAGIIPVYGIDNMPKNPFEQAASLMRAFKFPFPYGY